MPGFVVVDPSRDQRWDAFVHEHPFGWLCHLSKWREVLEKTFKHMKGHYYALMDSSGRLRAALPMVEVRSWLTGNRLVSLPFATLSDPLVTEPEDLDELLKVAMDLSKDIKARYLEVRTLNTHALFDESHLTKREIFVHHYLRLEDTPDMLKKRFHRSCVRQRIDRALKSDLTLRLDNDLESLATFYNLYVMTRKRVSLPPLPLKFINALWQAFAPSRNLQILIAEHEKRAVAGLILLKYKQRVSAEFAASDDSFTNLSPNHFLFWEAIKLAHREGYKIFDFGRTSPDNTSLMDFKRRWATTAVLLPQFYYPIEACEKLDNTGLSMKHRIIRKIVDMAPLYAMRAMGELCYRHVG